MNEYVCSNTGKTIHLYSAPPTHGPLTNIVVDCGRKVKRATAVSPSAIRFEIARGIYVLCDDGCKFPEYVTAYTTEPGLGSDGRETR